MDLLSPQDLRNLIAATGGPCVSLYLPTSRRSTPGREDPLRLRNMLTKAQDMLDWAGHRRARSKGFFQQANALLMDGGFWRSQSDGLAVFISPDMFRYYRLPVSFPEVVVVGERFHIRPLLGLMRGEGRFFVLALSLSKVRLMDCTRHSFVELSLPRDMPASLQEALKADELEKSLQFHTRTQPAGPGVMRGGIFHSHGAWSDEDVRKVRIHEFFQQVDGGVMELAGRNSPLVLAAVDYLHPIYRDANHHPNLLDEGIIGNPDRLSPAQLHQQAYGMVAPHFEEATHRALALYGARVDSGRSTTELRKIVPAAMSGGVEVLMLADRAQLWGRYQPELNLLHVHENQQPGDEDLLDLAAVHTLLHKGQVFPLDPADVPDGQLAAAILRHGGQAVAIETPAVARRE